MRRLSPAVLIAALALAAAAPADAKAPPTGKYDCVISGSTLFGTLTIKSGGRYTHRGSKGTFSAKGGAVKYPDGIRAYRISFSHGTLHRMKGRWHRTSDGVDEIALRNPKNGMESIYCDRRK